VKHWIQTRSGVAFDLANPQPSMVSLHDVAFALSHTNRFSGHAGAYSVAQHCLLVAAKVREATIDAELTLAALLHDAAEAYCGDVTSPVKSLLGDHFWRIEWPVACAIAQAFGLKPWLLKHDVITYADMRMLATERRDLMGPPPQEWELERHACFRPYDDVTIEPLSPEECTRRYMTLALALMSEIASERR
jgi:uncharacterized protein